MQRLIPDKYASQLLCSSKLSNSFVEWFVWQTVYSFGSIDLNEIGAAVAENYPVNVTSVRDYCRDNLFKESTHAYSVHGWQAEILQKVELFRSYFRHFGQDDGEDMFSIIKSVILNREKESVIVCAAVSRLDQVATGRKDVDYIIMFFDYLRYGKAQVQEMEEKFASVLPENRDIPLDILFTNDKVVRALSFAGITDIKSLLEADLNNLADILFLDLEDVIQTLKGLTRPAEEMLHESVKLYFGALVGKNQSRLRAFSLRYGIGEPEGRAAGKTLQQIGETLGLTRERARQLIEKSEAVLKTYAPQILTFGAIVLRNKYGNYRVRTMNEVETAFGCLDDLQVFSVAAQLYGDSRVSYDEPLDIFYEPRSTRIHDVKSQVLDGLGDIISPDEFDAKRDFEKKIILTEYSKRDSGFYVKKGKLASFMVTSVIDRFFPSGYHFGGAGHQDFVDLCKCLRQAYGEQYPLPTSAHAVEALIQQHGDYCLVDRGTYVSRSSVIEPGILLLSAVYAFIEENGPTVYYDSIFEKFKDEFAEIGATNAFYAKGLIDPYLVDRGFHTKRNYVQTEVGAATARETMLAFMREQRKPFSMQDLRNRFPGVKDYVFIFAIDESSDILLCDKSEYISTANSGMTENGRKLLVEIVEEAIKAGDGITNAHRIYGRLRLFHRGHEKEFGYIQTPRGIFSYAAALPELAEKYDFRRPFIAVKGSIELNHATVMSNHFLKLQSFTIKDCQAYRQSVGFGNCGTFSFVSFVDSLSDDFVLADRYLAIRKDALGITNSQLEKVRNTLLMIIRTRGEFDSRDTAALSYFPQVIGTTDLNVYLLMGIVQTYLSDYFTVETEATGTALNYKIKEVK